MPHHPEEVYTLENLKDHKTICVSYGPTKIDALELMGIKMKKWFVINDTNGDYVLKRHRNGTFIIEETWPVSITI